MITINLLPKNLKRAERKAIILPYKALLVAVFGVFVFLHLVLFSLSAYKGLQVFGLKRAWAKIEPQSKDSASTNGEIKKLQNNVNSLNDVVTRKVSLTEILSGLCTSVPKGLWLERLTYSSEGLMIQGSVVSLSQSEMSIIAKFLQDLKNNKSFASAFSKIELSNVQRRTIKTYDVVDFVFLGELKK
jgi:hypothetical protein